MRVNSVIYIKKPRKKRQTTDKIKHVATVPIARSVFGVLSVLSRYYNSIGNWWKLKKKKKKKLKLNVKENILYRSKQCSISSVSQGPKKLVQYWYLLFTLVFFFHTLWHMYICMYFFFFFSCIVYHLLNSSLLSSSSFSR